MSSSSSSSGGSGGSGGGCGGVGVETPPIVVDHLSLSSPSDQLCYVHCNFCDTVLAVSKAFNYHFKVLIQIVLNHDDYLMMWVSLNFL